ncbi:hypothetical protein K490DRAFT_60263 [Saccharata proteae CBS 121410]|uniref:Uncharacterized protein n=1 Tax=Saccharata proteae CBS 121410 TaxID=1314787 RepID=A0A9P4HNA4_9PEZI|nr:hypothetical protein K490DRAFT_60263 [Saccharata proteae CBS 121410]
MDHIERSITIEALCLEVDWFSQWIRITGNEDLLNKDGLGSHRDKGKDRNDADYKKRPEDEDTGAKDSDSDVQNCDTDRGETSTGAFETGNEEGSRTHLSQVDYPKSKCAKANCTKADGLDISHDFELDLWSGLIPKPKSGSGTAFKSLPRPIPSRNLTRRDVSTRNLLKAPVHRSKPTSASPTDLPAFYFPRTSSRLESNAPISTAKITDSILVPSDRTRSDNKDHAHESCLSNDSEEWEVLERESLEDTKTGKDGMFETAHVYNSADLFPLPEWKVAVHSSTRRPRELDGKPAFSKPATKTSQAQSMCHNTYPKTRVTPPSVFSGCVPN